ncbi:TetR/AcrR family transcriptional regulator [Limosilactobacillus sp.]|uniref:TetR/AcrR family transcriptional regulator n=1 Tax=Limosilactobacillus sp. TaxID=2773925 RepID=UPI0025C61B7E|nr:TetR/AcrR family transcriptional regulator [Limosilactobacillus sp.]MCH3922753.1 TetR/AcrR family transcriptional regulator [Limosilactobacillus sp.]MCH3927436.1 TetR/AcrR family transcriptional regulator [Limosilactobacillus sp.]
MSAENRKKVTAKRRKAILEAAIALFDEQGYENTKITDIAEKAAVSAGLIYHYFGSKAAILKSYGPMIEECQNYVLSLPTPRDSIATFCRRVIFPYRQTNYHSPIRILVSCYANGSLADDNEVFPFSSYGRDFLGKIIRRGQEAGQFRDGDPEAMGDILWHTVIGYIVHRLNYSNGKEIFLPSVDELVATIEK